MQNTNERQNPYLVLGLPYGSTKSEVRKAFAKRSKEIRKNVFNAYRIEDLNWALHRLEQAETDPDIDLEFYRAPANRTLLEEHLQMEDKSGFFNPSPKPIVRKTTSLIKDEETQLIDGAVTAWLSRVLTSNEFPIILPHPDPEPT